VHPNATKAASPPGGGLKFIVLSAVLYAPGTVLYFWARREQNKPVFAKPSDGLFFVLAVVGVSVGVSWLATGYITI
jgi:arginine:ornithine antiporter/lysine permease